MTACLKFVTQITFITIHYFWCCRIVLCTIVAQSRLGYECKTINSNTQHKTQDTTMWFCPLDGTLLQITQSSSTQSLYICSTCPYAFPITSTYKFSKKVNLERKVVDDILGGEKQWENVDRTMAVCPQCSYHEAYFMQMQIRSADEPMSVFYKCVKCSHQWSDR